MSRGLKLMTIIVVLITLVAIASVTYAYYLWTSPSSDILLSDEVIDISVTGDVDITGVQLTPVNDKSEGIIKNFTVENNSNISAFCDVYLDINTFDDTLAVPSFLYALYEVNGDNLELVNEGSFEKRIQGDTITLENNSIIEGSTTKSYRIYIWIDNSMENSYDMMGKSFALKVTAGASTKRSSISGQIITKTNINSNNIALGSYSEKGDFLVINRAPLGADYQVNVHQYEYRYIGKTPSNYVWFNCSATDINSHAYGDDEYEYNTTNCEKWRIIGVFLTEVPVYDDDSNIISYKWQYLTKIIRNNSIGGLSWDNKGTNGSNDWYTSRLMKTLNSGFETNDEDSDGTYESNSLYYNRISGTCFSGSSSAEISCNFTSSGLKTESKNYIENVKWYLGGQNSHSYIEYFYNRERSIYKYSTNTEVNWTGKIALMYPSDYGYASGSSCAMDTSRISYNNSNSDYRGCVGTNWMYNNGNEWMLSPASSNFYGVSFVDNGGTIGYGNTHSAYATRGVRPTLYLKQDTRIISGEGTSQSPYVITIE